MSASPPLVLTTSHTVAAPPRAVWTALTTPTLMQRWMLVPAAVVPDAPLAPGSRIEWVGDDGEPYLVGTVTVCGTRAPPDGGTARPLLAAEGAGRRGLLVL